MAENKKTPRHEVERTISLHMGVDSRTESYLLKDNTATRLENAIVNETGRLIRRNGMTAAGGIQNPPGGFHGFRNASQEEFLMGVWGSSIFKSTGSGLWEQIGCGTSLVSNLLHQAVELRHEGENAMAVATCEKPTETTFGLGTTGRSNLIVYSIDSDLVTAASLAPACIASFQNRIFYAEGELVGWSEIGQLASYSDSNNLLCEPGIGGRITAMVPARDANPLIWIFKERGIFVFEVRWGADGDFIATAGDALDTTRSSIKPLTIGTGCIATKSATWVPGVPGKSGADIFYLSRDGVRTLSRSATDAQQGASFPLSYNIPEWINRINWTTAHRASAAVFDNAYHLSVPLDGALDNTHVLRYDLATEAWTLHNMEMRDMGPFDLGSTPRLWGQFVHAAGDTSATGGSTDPSLAPYQLYRLFSGTHDASTSITERVVPQFIEESKTYTLGDPLVEKKWKNFTFQYSSDETAYIQIAVKPDDAEWVTLTETYLSASQDTIILGQDGLVWNNANRVVRRRTITLDDISPTYGMKLRIAGVTDATEVGIARIYIREIEGRQLSRELRNDA